MKTKRKTTPLDSLLADITPLPYRLGGAEGEEMRVIVGEDALVADCFAPSTQDLNLPADYQKNAAYLCHAANTLPELVAAVAAYIAWLDEPALDERENREGILRHALAAAQAVAL